MPSSVPLSISVICLPTEHLLGLLSITDYQYIVTLNSGGASPGEAASRCRSQMSRKCWASPFTLCKLRGSSPPAVRKAGLPAGTTSHAQRHHYASILLAVASRCCGGSRAAGSGEREPRAYDIRRIGKQQARGRAAAQGRSAYKIIRQDLGEGAPRRRRIVGEELDPAEEELTEEAATRVLRGESLRSITMDWNERGAKTVGGGSLEQCPSQGHARSLTWRAHPTRRTYARSPLRPPATCGSTGQASACSATHYQLRARPQACSYRLMASCAACAWFISTKHVVHPRAQ